VYIPGAWWQYQRKWQRFINLLLLVSRNIKPLILIRASSHALAELSSKSKAIVFEALSMASGLSERTRERQWAAES
jgi:hypothetical protein